MLKSMYNDFHWLTDSQQVRVSIITNYVILLISSTYVRILFFNQPICYKYTEQQTKGEYLNMFFLKTQ